MKIDDLIKRLLTKYPKLSENKNWGERGLFYNPNNQFSKGAYVLTFKEKDGKNDYASQLSRGGVYRLNLKISKETFTSLFGDIPKRPEAGKVIDTKHDFTKLNELMPHPVYGWMTWICILNPSTDMIESMENQGLFEEAYQAAVATIEKRIKTKEVQPASAKKHTLSSNNTVNTRSFFNSSISEPLNSSLHKKAQEKESYFPPFSSSSNTDKNTLQPTKKRTRF